ncbi:class I SAM-dependent methyltransferase [Denitromonas ohlonensis]|uniref:Class I SAM-dependent methyltransferase n=2 Tax=Denitromonas TaxID=139331 RepID=A0A557SEG0_9RHOO|nr:class I SAM-dependent methyltransferase [Denitromonas ohlonensis]TVO60280.1 class I SAM-dependent methyltransferase [Denitromonas ohlonensis]TVO75741.1 class I SAM-dependent methyltransferase [Denitromonas ohlonensis]
MAADQPSNYAYTKLKGQGEHASDFIVAMAQGHQNVLELGAGPGSVTRRLSTEAGCKVTAVELMDEFLPHLSPHCTRVVQANLDDPSWSDAVGSDIQYDLIIAGDVLEHLRDPQATLDAASQHLSTDGAVVVSLPHIGHCVIHACLMNEDFAYQSWGLLDRTHIRFFGIRNMQALMNSAGLKIIDVMHVCREPEDTEYAAVWRAAPSDLKAAIEQNPFAKVYQTVIKAVPFATQGAEISLIDHSPDAPRVTPMMRLNRAAKRLLPSSLYRLARRVYGRVLSR